MTIFAKKNSAGLPTTGKDIFKHVKAINQDNVIEIINYYKKYREENPYLRQYFPK